MAKIMIKNTVNNRITWIDIAKGICIFLVIISHFDLCPPSFRNFFLPFFLTGFFLLSGYVYKKPKCFKKLMLIKTKTILIPWLFFSVIDIIQLTLFGNENISFLQRIGYALLQIKGLNETLWFLPCLFISFIPFYFFTKSGITKKNFFIQFVLCTLSVLYIIYMNPRLLPWGGKTLSLPWHLNKIFISSFFMTIGYLLKTNNKLLKNIQNIKKIYIPIFIILYFIFTNIVGAHGINDCSSKSVTIWYFSIIIGNIILLIFSLNIPKSKLLLFIGKNSLLYYGLHTTVIRIINKIVALLNLSKFILSNIFIQYTFTIFLSLFLIILLIFPIKFINKHIKFILGKF